MRFGPVWFGRQVFVGAAAVADAPSARPVLLRLPRPVGLKLELPTAAGKPFPTRLFVIGCPPTASAHIERVEPTSDREWIRFI